MKLRRIETHEGFNDLFSVLDIDDQELRYTVGSSTLPDGSYVMDDLPTEYRAKLQEIVGDLVVEKGRFLDRIHPKAKWWLTTQHFERGVMIPVRISVPN